MNNLPNIIQYIIDNIDLNIDIKSINVDKIYVCDTLHITISKIIEVDGLDYKVVDFDFNNWLQVEPYQHSTPLNPSATTLKAPKITFLHGDPYSTNNEYLQLSPETLAKTPFIWLVESYKYDNLPADSSIEAKFKTRLFFLDWADEDKWQSEQHNEYVIKPMVNLKDKFIQVIEDDFSFKRLTGINNTVIPRFGVQVSKDDFKKPKKKVIDEDLSGIESNFDLEVYSITNCLCI